MNGDSQHPETEKPRGWLGPLAVALSVIAFLANLPALQDFIEALAGLLHQHLEGSENQIRILAWLLFGLLVTLCTGGVLFLQRAVRSHQKNRLSIHRERVRSLYLEELARHLERRRREAMPSGEELPLSCRPVPKALWSPDIDQDPATEALPMTPQVAFEEAQGQLLILGGAGSGKSTLLHAIALQLIEKAQADESAPLPVLLNLGSCFIPQKERARRFGFLRLGQKGEEYEGDEKDPLNRWIREALLQVSSGGLKNVADEWIEQHHLALLLDGLDEVPEDSWPTLVEILHQSEHFSHYWGSPRVVCSRRGEYEALTRDHGLRLPLEDAVILEKLQPEQVTAYLEALDRPTVLKALESDPRIRSLAETPLGVYLLLDAHEDLPSNSSDTYRTLDLRSQLIDGLVTRLTEREVQKHAEEASDSAPDTKSAFQVLEWLASHLVRSQAREMPLDRLPSFLFSGSGPHPGPLILATMLCFFGGVTIYVIAHVLLLDLALLVRPSEATSPFSNLPTKSFLGSYFTTWASAFRFLSVGFAYILVAFILFTYKNLLIGLATPLALGLLFGSATFLFDPTLSQQVFAFAGLVGWMTLHVLGKARRYTVDLGYWLAHLMVFWLVIQGPIELQDHLFLGASLLPCLGLFWLSEPSSRLQNLLSGFAVVLWLGAGTLVGIEWVESTRGVPWDLGELFLLAALIGLIFALRRHNLLQLSVHTLLTSAGLFLGGPILGICGACLWPFFVDLSKGRSLWLNRFWQGRIFGPLLLRTLILLRHLPSNTWAVLRRGARSGILNWKGRTVEFRHPVLRDHFALRPFLRQLDDAPTQDRIRFIPRLQIFGDLALPILDRLTRDSEIKVARAARTARMKLALASGGFTPPEPAAQTERFPVASKMRSWYSHHPAPTEFEPQEDHSTLDRLLGVLAPSDCPQRIHLEPPPDQEVGTLAETLVQYRLNPERIRRQGFTAILRFDGRRAWGLDTVLYRLTDVTGSGALLSALRSGGSIGEALETLRRSPDPRPPLWLLFENADELLDPQDRLNDPDLERLLLRWPELGRTDQLLWIGRRTPRLRDGRPFIDRHLGSEPTDEEAIPPRERVRQWLVRLGFDPALETFSSTPLEDRRLALQMDKPGASEDSILGRLLLVWLDTLPPTSHAVLAVLAYFPAPLPELALPALLAPELQPQEGLEGALQPLLRCRAVQAHHIPSGQVLYTMPADLQAKIRTLVPWRPSLNTARELHRLADAWTRRKVHLILDHLWRAVGLCFEDLGSGTPHPYAAPCALALLGRGRSLFFRDRPAEALHLFDRASVLFDSAEKPPPIEVLAESWRLRSWALVRCNRREEALAAAHRAVELLEPAFENGRQELAHSLALAHSATGIALPQDDQAAKLHCFERSTQLLTTATETERESLAADLANARINKAISLWSDDLQGALEIVTPARQAIDDEIEKGLTFSGTLAWAEGIEAFILSRLGRYDEALTLYDRTVVALGEQIEQGDDTLRMRWVLAATSLARLSANRGRTDRAIKAFEIAIAQHLYLLERWSIDSPDKVVDLTVLLGDIQWKAGRQKEALEGVHRLLELLQANPERTRHWQMELAKTLAHQGRLLLLQKKNKEAQEAYSRALSLYENLAGFTRKEATQELALMLRNLSLVKRRLKEPEQAIALLERAVEMIRKLEAEGAASLSQLAEYQQNLASCWREARQFAPAIEAYDLTIALWNRISENGGRHQPMLIEAYFELGFSRLWHVLELAGTMANPQQLSSLADQSLADMRKAIHLLERAIEQKEPDEEQSLKALLGRRWIRLLLHLDRRLFPPDAPAQSS